LHGEVANLEIERRRKLLLSEEAKSERKVLSTRNVAKKHHKVAGRVLGEVRDFTIQVDSTLAEAAPASL
jgi:uncharacterized membrane protein (UPF0182 family)